MKLIAKDGMGVRVLVGVAERIREILDEYDVILGVGALDGEEEAVAVVTAKSARVGVAATVEKNPRLVDFGG